MDAQGIKFCPDCSNMLYPMEDMDEKKLIYKCKSCPHKQRIENPDSKTCIVYYHEVDQGKVSIIIEPELCLDKTFSRTKTAQCEECGCNEAVFFQNPSPTGDLEMSLVFICCGRKPDGKLCGKKWIQEHHKTT